MPRYVRAFVPGGTFFFTVALLERRRRLLTDHVDDLRKIFADAQRRRPFTIDAIVVLPDHLHCIWTLPPDDADFSARWHDIKSRFSALLPAGERLSERRQKKGERGIWQRRFWEHVIRSEQDLERHLDYVYFNPVKHGHVRKVVDWPHSSFHRDVKLGCIRPIGVGRRSLRSWIWNSGPRGRRDARPRSRPLSRPTNLRVRLAPQPPAACPTDAAPSSD